MPTQNRIRCHDRFEFSQHSPSERRGPIGRRPEPRADLVEHHVEPESELGLTLGFSDIQTHFEGNFAWAVVDTEVKLTTSEGRDIHNTGHGTYLFAGWWMALGK